ncbi:hypothetical protein FG05_35123 [Fusarium graminearum]|nr:hypothetical protein FG05_35123 [Fusarium graminearum]
MDGLKAIPTLWEIVNVVAALRLAPGQSQAVGTHYPLPQQGCVFPHHNLWVRGSH